MGPLQYVNRSQYAWMMAVLLLGMPVILLAAWATVPSIEPSFKYISTACLVTVALLTGSRLADAGYRRWVGISLVLIVGVGLPAIAGGGVVFLLAREQRELGIAGAVLVLLILFLAF